jgi:nucleoside-diphosphate-sugar epimerase
MRYLVTGVAGFIGSHLLETLLERGDEVVGLDNFLTGHEHNIAPFRNDFEMIEGDIRDPEACARACKGVDHVLHQAALGSVPRSVEDPLLSHQINTTGTLNMLIAARDAEVSSFVFAASSSYFGDTDELPKHDQMPPRPLSPYAVTKVTCEQYLSVFSGVYGLPTVGLRYFNIFGPRQDPNGPYAAVIPKFVDLLLDGKTPTINGDGGQTRDFTYIRNAVLANLAAAENASMASGEIMNIACGDRISLNDLYAEITKLLGIDRAPIHGPERAGDIRDSLADISKAKELIGYEPEVTWQDGLIDTVEFFKQKHANQG